ncbi:MAG: hypothetical protein ABW252_03490 [Polyangiales bacterium]
MDRPRATTSVTPTQLVGARLFVDEPWVDLLALPCALLLGLLSRTTTLGRLLAYPLQIQFHELGHALMAWLTSRAALPLPFGFTFWKLERSAFTGGCVLFLLGVLGVSALRERRWFGLALAATLLSGFCVLTFAMTAEASEAYILAGGIAGELVLTSALLCGFYFPLPDRLRWDFFRFVALVPAATAWLESASLWRAVQRGTRALPYGSIMGGEGTGDLDRLIAAHAWTPEGIASLYAGVARLSALAMLAVYAVHATRALQRLRAR